MTTEEMKAKIISMQSNLVQIAGECMDAHKSEITALVVEQQYDGGISGDGSPLAPYSKPYARQKTRLGINQGHTDFSFSGGMHDEMDLIINEETYQILSRKEVNGYSLSTLLTKRDPLSFDLDDESKLMAWNIIKPDFEGMVKGLLD